MCQVYAVLRVFFKERDMEMEYNNLKKKALEHYFSRTNERQREAIFQINGAVLIIAGAGSGKTTVLCNRIAKNGGFKLC